jgi:excisionase family DNA binding protein
VRVLVDGCTVQEVSTRLGVNRARAQALVTSGVLAAERVGGQWIVPEAEVARLARIPRIAGRPLDQSTAWAQIDHFERGDRSIAALPAQWGALNARARTWIGRVLPEFADMASPPIDLRLGGTTAAHAHGAAVRPGPPHDVYLAAGAVPAFVKWSAFERVTSAPNIVVHIVSAASWDLLAERDIIPLVAAWLDLADAGDRGATEAMFTLKNRS